MDSVAQNIQPGPVTIYRIEGSIVVYLLIGLIFANLYHLTFQLKGLTNALKEWTMTLHKRIYVFQFCNAYYSGIWRYNTRYPGIKVHGKS
jgi:hypothetical protein